MDTRGEAIVTDTAEEGSPVWLFCTCTCAVPTEASAAAGTVTERLLASATVVDRALPFQIATV